MEMNSKKIFVYDTTNEFSTFIKKQYLNNCSIDVCKNINFIDDFHYAYYDVFFIIITEPKDFQVLFKTVNNPNSLLFLGTSLEELKDKLKETKRILNLDMCQNKRKLKKYIDSNMNTVY